MNVKSSAQCELRLKKLWLVIGCIMILIIIHQSLTSSPVQIEIHLSDKFYHAFAYFVLMAWFVQIYHGSKYHLVSGVSFVFMGVGLEFLQYYGGIRYFEIADMVANTAGVVIAWMFSNTRLSRLLYFIEMRIFSLKLWYK